jgi:formylmethanofuran dehydrogenase subunit E
MGAFLDLFLDSEYVTRRDISSVQKEAHDAMFYGNLALHNVDALRAQVLAQREQIRDLGMLVGVLVRILGEASVVDPSVLKYRVEAAIEERIEAGKPENRMVACTRCGKQVTAARTEMTADGTVCDVCMATRP